MLKYVIINISHNLDGICEDYQASEVNMISELMQRPAWMVRPLPNLAFRTAILSNPYSARAVQSYARALMAEYPEQKFLISDIADAALKLTTVEDRATIRHQLVELEWYLETSR